MKAEEVLLTSLCSAEDPALNVGGVARTSACAAQPRL
ncbi:uncharacterized protein CMC5_061360 [Chondromyces crocatus]|uniref:Uncharacterized protein n=1 Tax=Chondromyces crocatus TaxID=52 RepID=A0A0K1EM21_CHOCO|nr:uncharacterized protein CMC5_061360 [Chondromyces crocatus]